MSDKLYRCNNCDFQTDEHEAFPDVENLRQRLEPGDIMPSGQCPECGAFVHEYTTEFMVMMAAPRLLAACKSALEDGFLAGEAFDLAVAAIVLAEHGPVEDTVAGVDR